MNEKIDKLIKESDLEECIDDAYLMRDDWQPFIKKFAELIVRECDQLNRKQSFELGGVVVDVEQGDGFDSVCLTTVKRVESYLRNASLKKHFGVE